MLACATTPPVSSAAVTQAGKPRSVNPSTASGCPNNSLNRGRTNRSESKLRSANSLLLAPMSGKLPRRKKTSASAKTPSSSTATLPTRMG